MSRFVNLSSQQSSCSRRKFLQWGIFGLTALAATTVPQSLLAQTNRNRPKTLTFDADDVGILNFALLLEELEAAFYAAVVNSNKISDTKELDYLRALGEHEASHVEFLRNTLGNNVIFQTKDLDFNRERLMAVLRDRDTILSTAVTLEDLGVHAYNGAGPFLTNPTYLLAAGSIVSVEGRHAAGVRSLLGRPVTESDENRLVENRKLVNALNPLKGRAYDELYTPRQVVEILSSIRLLNNRVNGKLFDL